MTGLRVPPPQPLPKNTTHSKRVYSSVLAFLHRCSSVSSSERTSAESNTKHSSWNFSSHVTDVVFPFWPWKGSHGSSLLLNLSVEGCSSLSDHQRITGGKRGGKKKPGEIFSPLLICFTHLCQGRPPITIKARNRRAITETVAHGMLVNQKSTA